ncbi:hypothetical protein PPGU19_091070 (plasmid) [Paraburkholderia sp. PGU19]|nr:hypothetical protein PPGU19_091070 [Paraburkholderia sp. PGU19]
MLVQLEPTLGLSNLEEIAEIDGVDGVFFGPADLSASMGFLGKPGVESVREATRTGIRTVRKAGKAAGVLAPDRAYASEYLEAGATFVAVGTDTGLLSLAAAQLAAEYKGTRAPDQPTEKGGY